jgi:methyltransferase-like protein/2-polyprenyl-3-methyl-5-hydroxy-6-metoxy-1,4-benzoquinol methylase
LGSNPSACGIVLVDHVANVVLLWSLTAWGIGLMLAGQTSSYDEIPYSDNCFPYTHPDRLAAVKALFGMSESPLDHCRVLELGCARGGNLVPMALELPAARFVGIDLSARQIAEGRSVVEKLGLQNVDLRAMCITEVDERHETYDYIICHGVYSWVPEPVRSKILAICAESLAPDGVAYVSYNTYPGWHARGMVRELMAYHVRRSSEPHDRVEQARVFLDELVRVLPDPATSYARILRTETELLRKVANAYLYHEHLDETNHPVYFQEFIDRARESGLNFLAESATPGLSDALSLEARHVLDGWAEDDVSREQYLDFLCNRTFRRTLLCQAEAKRHATPSPDAIPLMSISTGLIAVAAQPEVVSDKPEKFRMPEGQGTVTTNNPLVKAALVALSEVRPGSLSFAAVWNRVQACVGQECGGIATHADSRHILAESLLHCFLSDLVDLHVRPPRFARIPTERPMASPLARLQAEDGGRVTNLRRRNALLNDFDRVLLGQLDGTRDRTSVLEALRGLVAADDFTIYDGDQPIRDQAKTDAILAAELEPTLQKLAKLALLVA